LFSKPYNNANVTVFSPAIELLDMTVTDEEGRFRFDKFEFPDSTTYIVQALTRKGADRVELYLDPITYPAVSLPWTAPSAIAQEKESDLTDYVNKADRKYIYENGMRIVQLKEVIIKGVQKETEKIANHYKVTADYSITEDDLEKFPPSDLSVLFIRLPGVMVSSNDVTITRTGGSPLFVVDGMRLESFDDLKSIVVPSDIAQVDLIKSGGGLVVYGPGASNGVIEIMTKRGKIGSPPVKFNMQVLSPLGYQKPVAFYAPKYDTPDAVRSEMPDLRSTIFWKPDVIFSPDGKAETDFYTADSSTTYSIVIEGILSNGKLLYHRDDSLFSVKK
jgi:hypothetical protein